MGLTLRSYALTAQHRLLVILAVRRLRGEMGRWQKVRLQSKVTLNSKPLNPKPLNPNNPKL